MKAIHVPTKASSFDRVGLIGVTVLGFAMCSGGVGKIALSGQWLTFPGLAGSLLGLAALGTVAARVFGKPLPGIASDRAAIAAIVTVVIVKLAIAAIFTS